MSRYKNKTEVVRTVIGLCLSFIAAFFAVLFVVLTVLSLMTSKAYIKFTVKNTDYAQKTVSYLEDHLADLAIPSGLGEDYFRGKINTKHLEEIENACFDANYASGAFNPDTTALKQEILNGFIEFANCEKTMLSDESDQALDTLADMCVAEYINAAAPKVFRYLSLYSGKLFKYFIFGAVSTAILSAGLIYFIKRLFKNGNSKTFIYFAICSSAIIEIILPAILLIQGAAQKLNISPAAAHGYICGYINGGLVMLLTIGLLMLVCCGVLFSKIIKQKD